ncbi:MAG: Do family serine endopeptidase [Campylobacterales bacterium]|nr:Do family serine endopeptidase [Campylobacterales bacterium]
MKSKILLSSLVALSLYGSDLNLNLIDQNPKRTVPTSMDQIYSFNQSVKEAVKSVVNISTKQRIKQGINPIEQMFSDPLFKHFFGQNFGGGVTPPRERIQQSLGSGVILAQDGYIITNAHVVENADEIVVALGEKSQEYNAKLIGIDKDSDLAVIKVDANNLIPIKVGSSKNLQVGDLVFAIGDPFGVGQTVTQGIVSALNKNKVGINKYENFIQTDASINPGNSGGALIDSRGALIGINSAIMTRSGGNNGVGFAIPVSMVKTIATKLIKDGKVTRGYLGVSIDDLSKDLQSVYKHKKGAVILDVSKDTPAYKFNLQRGDLVYKVNNISIGDASEFSRVIGSFNPDEKITLYIERDKKDITIDIVLGSRDSLYNISSNSEVLNGLYLSEITPELQQQYRVPQGSIGVLVTDVKAASAAEKLGFQAGDILIQIENIEIQSIADVEKALVKYQNNPKRVYVNRYGRILMSVVE